MKIYTSTSRLIWILKGWGTVGILYFFSYVVQRQGKILPLTWIDELLSFKQWAIWPYLSFFILVPIAYLFSPIHRVRWLAYTMSLTALCATTVYFIYPTTMTYPIVDVSKLDGKILQLLVSIDSTQNCLPSLHASLSLLSIWALIDSKKVIYKFLYIFWFMIISLSIIMLRRHLFMDWLTGCLLALVIGYFVSAFFKKEKNMPHLL